LPAEEQAALLAETGYDGIGYTGCQGIPEMLAALDARKLKMFSTYVGAEVGPNGAAYDPQLGQAVEQLAGRETLLWLFIRGGKPSSDEFDDQAVAMTQEIADLAAGGGCAWPSIPMWGSMWHGSRTRCDWPGKSIVPTWVSRSISATS
jgi:hypothetical protein